MKQLILEKFIESLKVDVYPVTLAKFLLNKRRILTYISKASNKDFEIKGPKIKIDYSDCELCKQKEAEKILCRQHTSIHRIINADNVLFDQDNHVYFYKNEIFRRIGDKLIIIYCPHPKLISGPVTDAKVRKVNILTIDDPKMDDYTILKENMTFQNMKSFTSTLLLDQFTKCWFNDDFSIVTIPEDRNYSNFCLIPNR